MYVQWSKFWILQATVQSLKGRGRVGLETKLFRSDMDLQNHYIGFQIIRPSSNLFLYYVFLSSILELAYGKFNQIRFQVKIEAIYMTNTY